MDLSNPMASVVPGGYGAVLAVLARTYTSMSGRKIAELTQPKMGHVRVNEVLAKLAGDGLVLREDHPPAKSYVLNRDHVAAEGIMALANQWTTLMQRIREDLGSWDPEPLAACIFGSAARGHADSDSDIDLLIVPPVDIAPRTLAELEWEMQLERLAEQVHKWTGNACEVLQLTTEELSGAVDRNDRLVRELRTDALDLHGIHIRKLLRPGVAE